jgi:hypothetical protein
MNRGHSRSEEATGMALGARKSCEWRRLKAQLRFTACYTTCYSNLSLNSLLLLPRIQIWNKL